MKYYFIINPVSGQGKSAESLRAQIREACAEKGVDAQIFETRGVRDAEIIAAQIAKELNGEEATIWACGGDGTAGEVVNGIVGHPNITFGVIPTGTGNDTIRNFGPSQEAFLDIKAQLEGSPQTMDLMQYTGVIDGVQETRYCGNMFNNGFDCNVVDATAKLKTYPLISGSLAYLLGVASMFIKKKGISLKIYADGELVSTGPILLCAIANGSYCGGGICSSPQAIINDGLMDLNIIGDTTRRRFLKLFPSYTKGEHLHRKDIQDILSVYACKEVRLLPDGTDDFLFCADGETARTTGLTITMCPGALRIQVPAVPE